VVINQANGRVVTVTNHDKLRQDVRELLSIDTQDDTGFGAGLDSMIGQLPSDEMSPGSVNFSFGMLLRSAFSRFQQLQRAFQFGSRSLQELVNRILFAQAAPSKTNPTQYVFSVAIQSMAGKVVKSGGNIQL